MNGRTVEVFCYRCGWLIDTITCKPYEAAPLACCDDELACERRRLAARTPARTWGELRGNEQ